MPPVWLRLRIRRPGRRNVSLWLPVILVWVLLAALMLILLPFALLFALLTAGRGPGPRLLLAYPLLWSVIWHLSGLHVETRDADTDVLFSFQ